MICRLITLSLLFTFTLCAKPIAPPEFDTPEKRLLLAVVQNNVSLAEEAISAGAGVEMEFARSGHSQKMPPLQLCAMLGNREVAELLLEKGAHVAAYDRPFRGSAFETAAANNQLELLRLLIPQVNRIGEVRASLYESALSEALGNGHLGAVKLLIESGMSLEGVSTGPGRDRNRAAVSKSGVRALWIAAKHGEPSVVEYLLDECGVDANNNYGGATSYPLWKAVERGNIEAARLLLEKGADVRVTEFGRPNQMSCLAISVRQGHLDCAELLLEYGAKPVASNPELNPKIQADWSGFDEYVDRFTAMGAEVDLWGSWQKNYRASRKDLDSQASSPPAGFAAHLIDHDWEHSTVPQGLDRSDVSRVAILGDIAASDFSDLLMAEMSGRDGIELVERAELERIIREHELSRTGLLQFKGLRDLSQLIAAKSILLISTVEFNKNEIYRIQLLDVDRGIVLNVRYAPKEKDAWEGFCSDYAGYLSGLLIVKEDSSPIPVSLVGVQANWGTSEGKRLEKDLFLNLQYALSRKTELLLLDRESLERLASEKRIGGTQESLFESSGVFLSARVDVDLVSGEVHKVTLQATESDDAGSEAMVYEAFAGEKSLAELSGIVVDRFLSSLADEPDVGVEFVSPVGSIEKDRRVMVEQADWLYRVGLFPEAHQVVQNAVALGANDGAVWKLYLMILEQRIPLLWPESRANELNNRQILELEHERLHALEKYMKGTLSAGDKARASRRLNWSIHDVLKGFGHSLFRMRAVCMKRRYGNELRELEGHFKNVFDRTINPICAGKHLHDKTRESLLLSSFWVLPHLSQQPPEEHERLVAESISGLKKFWVTTPVYPRSVNGGMAQWNSWIREHGSPSFVAEFYKSCGKFLLSWNGSGNQYVHFPSAYRQEAYRAELSDYLDGLDALEAGFLYNLQQIQHSPRNAEFMLPRHEIKVMTPDGEMLQAETYASYLKALPKSHQVYRFETKLPIGRYTDLTALRKLESSAQSALLRVRRSSSHDVLVKELTRLESSIANRISELEAPVVRVERTYPVVDAYVWDLSTAVPNQENRFFIWRGDRPPEYVFSRDGAQWIIGKYYKSENKVWLFRMDEQTRATTYQTFLIPENVEGLDAAKSFILFTDQKIVFGGNKSNDTMVLDRKTMAVSSVSEYVPYNASSRSGSYRSGHIHDGSLYYTAVPEYLKSAKPKQARGGLVFLKLNLETMKHTVLFNFRRNPPETPLDKPLTNASNQKGFDFYYNKAEGVFIFNHDGNKYKYDPANDEYIELKKSERRKLIEQAVRHNNSWSPQQAAGQSWSKPRFVNDLIQGANSSAVLPLYNYQNKRSKAIGLNLKPLTDNSLGILDEVATAIRDKKHEMNMTCGDYSTFYFQEPARFVFIANEPLADALD